MSDRNQKSAGFTLIEVLIAVVVLAVALAGMIPVLVHTVRANTFAGMTSRAATYSQDKLEELRSTDFSEILVSAGTDNPEGLFSRSWTVDASCLICIPDLVVGIEVATQWTDRTGTHISRYYTVQADVK